MMMKIVLAILALAYALMPYDLLPDFLVLYQEGCANVVVCPYHHGYTHAISQYRALLLQLLCLYYLVLADPDGIPGLLPGTPVRDAFFP